MQQENIRSKLHFVIDKSYLLSRFERRQANIRTTVTAERISKRTVATGANFALDGEVDFV
jgi:hypothetical protein